MESADGCLWPCATVLLPRLRRNPIAVIASRSPGVEKLAPLLELELGKKQGIVLLEREHIKEVVREQELQALAAAEGTSKRIGLEKPLKADLLILLREQEDEQPPPGASDASLPQSDPPRPHARLVVCETRAGSAAVQPAGRADARRGSRRPRRRPPGRGRDREAAGAKRGHRGRAAACNNTLAYDADYLRSACAKSIELLLTDLPGVVVVELDEANAIARELAVAGGEIERRLPLYLLGEYRLDGTGRLAKPRSSLRCVAARRRSRCDRAKTIPRRTCRGSYGRRPPRCSPRRWASRATTRREGRSRAIGRAGTAPCAIGRLAGGTGVTEAALVLDPGRFDLHRDAVNLLNWIYFQKLRDQPQRRTNNPADRPEERLAREMLPTGLIPRGSLPAEHLRERLR